MFISFLLAILALYGVASYGFNHHGNFAQTIKKACITGALSFLVQNQVPILDANAAGNPAIEAATRAMLDKKEKQVDTRDFNSLSDASKKRKSMKLCKDDKTRKAAGYRSSTDCSNDVLQGNYQVAIGGASAKPPGTVKSTVVEAAPISLKEMLKEPSVPVAQKVATVASVPEPPVTPQKRGEKTNDMSDLNPAQLRRRAIAGCKKADVRQAANMGSESKCTEQVMAGDFAQIIDVLEYQ